MRVHMLTEGDEAELIAVARIFNDIELTAERAKQILRDPNFIMVVASTGDGSPISRIYAHVLNRMNQTDLFIYEVDTLEGHRRNGAARRMLAFLRDLCRSRGYGEMFVPTECGNVAANALYRSSGGVLEGSPANIYVYPTTSG